MGKSLNDVTSEEFGAMLRELQATYSTERKPGEFTIIEYAAVNDLDYHQASNAIDYRCGAGIINRVTENGKPARRLIDGRLRAVFVDARK